MIACVGYSACHHRRTLFIGCKQTRSVQRIRLFSIEPFFDCLFIAAMVQAMYELVNGGYIPLLIYLAVTMPPFFWVPHLGRIAKGQSHVLL